VRGRAVPGMGHAGLLCGDTALALCTASPRAASNRTSASCRLADVQAHELSLKQQCTQGRGEWDNSSYNKRLSNLKAFV